MPKNWQHFFLERKFDPYESDAMESKLVTCISINVSINLLSSRPKKTRNPKEDL